jgi:hypothetical protein
MESFTGWPTVPNAPAYGRISTRKDPRWVAGVGAGVGGLKVPGTDTISIEEFWGVC